MTDCHPSILKAGDRAYVNAIRTALPNNFPSVLEDVLLSYANDVNVKLRGTIPGRIRKIRQIVYEKDPRSGIYRGIIKNIAIGLNSMVDWNYLYNPSKPRKSYNSPRGEFVSPIHSGHEMERYAKLELCVFSKSGYFDRGVKVSCYGNRVTATPRLMDILDFETCDDIGQIEPIETARDWQRERSDKLKGSWRPVIRHKKYVPGSG